MSFNNTVGENSVRNNNFNNTFNTAVINQAMNGCVNQLLSKATQSSTKKPLQEISNTYLNNSFKETEIYPRKNNQITVFDKDQIQVVNFHIADVISKPRNPEINYDFLDRY